MNRRTRILFLFTAFLRERMQKRLLLVKIVLMVYHLYSITTRKTHELCLSQFGKYYPNLIGTNLYDVIMIQMQPSVKIVHKSVDPIRIWINSIFLELTSDPCNPVVFLFFGVSFENIAAEYGVNLCDNLIQNV